MSEFANSLPRWSAKKLARAGVGAAGIGLGAVAGSAPRARAVTYHRFGPSVRQPFTLQPDRFERQVRFLADSGRAITLADLAAFVAGEGTLPRDAVLLTIDDGDPSVLNEAVPILRAHKVPAVLFALAGTPPGFPCLTDAQLKAVAAAGVEIGSHGVSHSSMGQLGPAEIRHEARASRERLEQLTGAPVTAFAYPFGTPADFSDASRAILEEAGYTLAFTSVHGAIMPGADPLSLPRAKIEAGDPDWLFPAICDGAMDLWRHLDVALHRKPTPHPGLMAAE